MIHNIQNPTQALDALHEVKMWGWEEPGTATPIFDLDKSLDSRDVPIGLTKCKTCGKVVNFKINQSRIKCPQCTVTMFEFESDAIVEMVVQGSVVLWRKQ